MSFIQLFSSFQILGEAFSLLILQNLNFMDPPETPAEAGEVKSTLQVVPWDEVREHVIKGVLATDLAHGAG